MPKILDITPRDIELMQELRDSGMSLIKIGEKFGCSNTAVKARTTKPEFMTMTKLRNDAIRGVYPTKKTPIYKKLKLVGYFVPVGEL